MQKAEVRNIGVGGTQVASATGTSTNTSSYTWASSSRMVLRMVVALLAMLALFFFTPAAVTAERCFKEVSEPLQEEYIHVFLLQRLLLSETFYEKKTNIQLKENQYFSKR